MRRIALPAAVVALIPALVAFTWPGTVEWLCTRGIKQYEAGKFEDAEASFARALDAEPSNNTLQFNRGTVLHRRGLQDEASEAFEAAASGGEPDLAGDAAYNRGNARFTASDYEGAIEAYKEALRLDPGDGEAKYNLELAMRKQQEEQEQEDQQQQDDQQEEDQQEEGDQPQQDQQQEEQPQDQQPQEDQDSSPDQQAAEGELTEEQAQRLLHALASQDAEMQKLIRRSPQRRQPREGEKDW